jgi:hypothetical protein
VAVLVDLSFTFLHPALNECCQLVIVNDCLHAEKVSLNQASGLNGFIDRLTASAG